MRVSEWWMNERLSVPFLLVPSPWAWPYPCRLWVRGDVPWLLLTSSRALHPRSLSRWDLSLVRLCCRWCRRWFSLAHRCGPGLSWSIVSECVRSPARLPARDLARAPSPLLERGLRSFFTVQENQLNSAKLLGISPLLPSPLWVLSSRRSCSWGRVFGILRGLCLSLDSLGWIAVQLS